MKRIILAIIICIMCGNNAYSSDVEYIDGYTPNQFSKVPHNVLLVRKINNYNDNGKAILLEIRDFLDRGGEIYYYCYDKYVMYEIGIMNGGSLTQLFWNNQYGVTSLVSCKQYIEQNGRNLKSDK